MRIPCGPMPPHHHASKLVFRLSIAHYLLAVTKITSLTFSLSLSSDVYVYTRLPSHPPPPVYAYVSHPTRISVGSSRVAPIDEWWLRNRIVIITRSRTGFSASEETSGPSTYDPKSSRGGRALNTELNINLPAELEICVRRNCWFWRGMIWARILSRCGSCAPRASLPLVKYVSDSFRN